MNNADTVLQYECEFMWNMIKEKHNMTINEIHLIKNKFLKDQQSGYGGSKILRTSYNNMPGGAHNTDGEHR